MIALFSASDRVGSLGTTTDFSSFWGTSLGVADCGRGNLFPCVDY